MFYQKNRGLKRLENPKQLGREKLQSFFFRPSLRRVSTKGKVKARTHPKAFPRSPLSIFLRLKEKKEERSKRFDRSR